MTPGERALAECAVLLIQVLLKIFAFWVSAQRGERARIAQKVLRDCRRELRKLQARIAANESALQDSENPEPNTETARKAATEAANLARALAQPETPAWIEARVSLPRRRSQPPARHSARPHPHPDRWRKNTLAASPVSTFCSLHSRNNNRHPTRAVLMDRG